MTAARALGGVRLVIGVFLLFTLIFQIVDLQIGGSLVPNEYFTFFTVESTMLNIVILIVTGATAWRGHRESTLLAGAAMAIVPYAVVTAAVYNVLLRGLPAEKYLGMDWPNEVLHVAVPAFLVVDWFVLRSVVGGRTKLPFRMIALAASFPVLWLAFTMIRGAVTGWFPYPFLEPDGDAGIGGVIGWSVGLFAFILLVSAAALAITRVGAARVSPRLVSQTLQL